MDKKKCLCKIMLNWIIQKNTYNITKHDDFHDETKKYANNIEQAVLNTLVEIKMFWREQQITENRYLYLSFIMPSMLSECFYFS